VITQSWSWNHFHHQWIDRQSKQLQIKCIPEWLRNKMRCRQDLLDTMPRGARFCIKSWWIVCSVYDDDCFYYYLMLRTRLCGTGFICQHCWVVMFCTSHASKWTVLQQKSVRPKRATNLFVLRFMESEISRFAIASHETPLVFRFRKYVQSGPDTVRLMAKT